LRSKWLFAVAALALLVGVAGAVHALLRPGSPTAAPAGLAGAAPLLAAATLEIPAPAALLPASAPAQYGSYSRYRESVRDLGGNRHEFYFTRGIYSGWRGYGRRGGSWATDYPKADIQFLWGLKRLSNINAYDNENAVMLTDPDLRRYPFLYMLEVGYMQLTPPEVEGLRDYLAAGGFLFIDDFWGTYEWENFEWEIHKVLPGSQIVELSLDHPLFSTFYDIPEILQVPNVGNARRGITSERDGYVPHVRAIFDEEDRLLVLINWNTDLGDAWEWAEDPWYPLTYSNYAYQMAVNAIVYAMSH
jgi:hypothetical protein